MDKWEYLTRCDECCDGLGTLESELNRLRQEGWELAGFVTDNSVAYCVLKRKVDSQPVNSTMSREQVSEWVRESLKREAWR